MTNWSEADKLKVPCDWLTRFRRVISHETMKLVKMIDVGKEVEESPETLD